MRYSILPRTVDNFFAKRHLHENTLHYNVGGYKSIISLYLLRFLESRVVLYSFCVLFMKFVTFVTKQTSKISLRIFLLKVIVQMWTREAQTFLLIISSFFKWGDNSVF